MENNSNIFGAGALPQISTQYIRYGITNDAIAVIKTDFFITFSGF